jgi:hypothetical protein
MKATNEAAEHAKTMILLQRTQKLDINEWREVWELAYARFGKEIYKKLLQERDETIPEMPKGSIPTFNLKRLMFGALKEEQGDMTPEWLLYLPEIYESLRGGQNPAEVLQQILHL